MRLLKLFTGTGIRSGTLLLWSALLMVGCASKPTQGYSLPTAQNTAALAQAQMQQAERATEVDTAQTYLDLIVQMQKAGQWYASLAHADAFIQQHGRLPPVLLLRADALRNTEQWDGAMQLYLQLAQVPLTAARAYRGIGLIHAAHERYAEALQALEHARQLHPIDGDVLSDIAYAYMLGGQLEAARVPALQAAQLAPHSPRVQMNLALFWMATGQQALAMQVVQQLHDTVPVGERRPPTELMSGLQQQALRIQAVLSAARTQQEDIAQEGGPPTSRSQRPYPGVMNAGRVQFTAPVDARLFSRSPVSISQHKE